METNLSQPLDLPKMTLELLPELILPEVKEASRKLEEKEKELRWSSSHCAFAAAHELRPFPFPMLQNMSTFVPYL